MQAHALQHRPVEGLRLAHAKHNELRISSKKNAVKLVPIATQSKATPIHA